ncbi:hypothetical protein HNY73_004655 [Argiope bruennichi]|uniref:Uncharacterized protein n=1 Tax=Argiope bruennichi TaxID=94029 RepID=A0A8T0FWG5_ARGBR|nr:hypothetical protein HNY73_004655 [Argiope bruennichi]
MPLISYHNQIETQIENFVENFKKNGSVLISTLNVEAYNNTRTQWTPSDDSATEYPRTSAGCSSYDSSGSDSCSYGEAGNSDNGILVNIYSPNPESVPTHMRLGPYNQTSF